MAIEKRISQDGRPAYRVRVADHDPMTGKRRNVTIGTYDRKKDAEAAERDAMTRRDRGTLLDPVTTTVGQLLDEWLKVKATTVSTNTLADYESVIRLHVKPALGSIRVQALKADRVQAQYARWTEEGKSARLVQFSALRLSQSLDYAVKLGIVYGNVTDHCVLPRIEQTRLDVWTGEELRRFLAVAETDVHAPLWYMLAAEGLRRGEALGLRWADLNWGRGTAHLTQTVIADKSDHGRARIQERTKTAAGARSVRLTAETLAVLRAHRKRQAEQRLKAADWVDHDLIVTTRSGAPIGPAGSVGRSFEALIKRAGLRRIRVHDLRHTHATLLLLAGVPAKIVSERLGHASIGITLDLYSHVLPEMQGEAALAFSRILAAS